MERKAREDTPVSGRIVLLLGDSRVSAVCLPRKRGLPRIVGHVDLPGISSGTHDSGDDLLDRLVSACVELMDGIREKTVAIGLPGSWLDHCVVETPALRRLDATALLLREVLKATQLPEDDLLFAEASEPLVDSSSGRKQKRVSHLLSAARESTVLGLVKQLRGHGIRVVSAVSPAAALLVRAIRQSDAGQQAAETATPAALILLRRDGFAIALHLGRRIHQFRQVNLLLPGDTESLAQVLAEELRRSSVYFRENRKGESVRSATILGRFCGDQQQLAREISQQSGIHTSVDEECDDDTDERLEAAAIRDLGDDLGRGDLQLLPTEVTRKRVNVMSTAVCAVVVAASLSVSGLLFQKLGSEIENNGQLMAQIEETRKELNEMELQRYELLTRTGLFETRRDQLKSLLDGRFDHAVLLLDIAARIPADIHLQRIEIVSPVGAPMKVLIEGRVYSDQWNSDQILAGFTDALRLELGLSVAVSNDELTAGESELVPFLLTITHEETDESSES